MSVLLRSFIVQKVSLLVLVALSVSSQTTGDIRLTGYGSNPQGGLLEVYLNGQWGSVCGSTTFSITTASVACRQLGLGPAVDVVYYPDLRYGISNQNLTIGNIVCNGEESHLLRCHYDQVPNCSPYQNIGIMCSASVLPYSGSVRISKSSVVYSVTSGYLQMYFKGEWRHVCNDKVTFGAANSACRQLGYTSAENFTSSNSVSPSPDSWWTVDPANCTDSPCLSTCAVVEGATACPQGVLLLNCLFDPSETATITAGNQSTCELNEPYNNDVRMTALSDDGVEGVPEVYVSEWLKVCLEPFTVLVGDVLCKQLGHPAALRHNSVAANGGSNVGVELVCTGVESSSQECLTIVTNCTGAKFVNLRCVTDVPPYGSLRLFNGSGSAGSLHLFDGSLYVPLCDHGFGTDELTVACRQLGYKKGIQVVNNALYGLSKFTTAPYDTVFHCGGFENHLLECDQSSTSSHVCRNPYDAVSIQCGEAEGEGIRLHGGDNTSGLLEVQINGRWGTVCGMDFSHYDAHVACRELGFKTASEFTMKELSSHSVPVHITSLQCSGFEDRLLSCPHQVADNGSCQHHHDVYLNCSHEYPANRDGEIRLTGGSTPNTGRLEILYNGLWMSVCGKLFNKKAANVACRQMRFTHVETYCTNSCNGNGSEHIFFGETICQGNEMELIGCKTDIHNRDLCDHQNIVWITCSDINISNGSTSSTILRPTSATSATSSLKTVPNPTNTSPIKPRPLLPFPSIYLYVMLGGVILLLLVSIVLTALVCCTFVYKKNQRRFRGPQRRPELDLGVDEPDMATSPRATNAAFLGISPPQSSDDISMADLKACPQKELELRGLNTVTGGACASSREPSGVFEEVDFGLELPPPPRYDELDFEDSCEFGDAVLSSLHDHRAADKPSVAAAGSDKPYQPDQQELKFTTIRIDEL